MVKPPRQSQLFNTLVDTWAAKLRTAHRSAAEAAGPSSPVAAKPSLHMRFDSHLRVLVAEDNVINQKVAVRILERMGIRADVAANGREVVEMMRILPYDVIFMDCQMPEMNGYEAATEIRRREGSGRHIAIIAMTAEALAGTRERCLASGMDDYVPKPIQIGSLMDALKRWAPAIQVFFQAEDGIRDWSVTGVQTCALPISTKPFIADEMLEQLPAPAQVGKTK